MSTPTFDAGTLPRSHAWYILEVMRKRAGGFQWAACLIDVDPDDFVNQRCNAYRSCFLDLGRHRSHDDAWDAAEQVITTRH